jgi:hypothetical protein
MNTRKDFWRAVEIIRASTPEAKPWLITAFIAFFSKDNPRFDADRFLNAANAE